MQNLNIKPMLAKSLDKIDKLPKQVFVQPKYDGQRAVWDGKQLWSRTGKLILNVPHIIEELSANFNHFPLDGELYIHGKTLQDIISDSRKTVNLEANKLEYHIYDIPIDKVIFSERYEILLTKFKNIKSKFLKSVPTKLIKVSDYQNLNLFHPEYEGTMVRIPSGLYKFGKRSSDLLKVKEFMDDEFVITGVTELQHREKVIVPAGTPGSKPYADGRYYKDGTATPGGVMGSLVLVTAAGKVFECGTGYDDITRAKYFTEPPIGKKATIQFKNYTPDGIPFHPSFICLRDYD